MVILTEDFSRGTPGAVVTSANCSLDYSKTVGTAPDPIFVADPAGGSGVAVYAPIEALTSFSGGNLSVINFVWPVPVGYVVRHVHTSIFIESRQAGIGTDTGTNPWVVGIYGASGGLFSVYSSTYDGPYMLGRDEVSNTGVTIPQGQWVTFDLVGESTYDAVSFTGTVTTPSGTLFSDSWSVSHAGGWTAGYPDSTSEGWVFFNAYSESEAYETDPDYVKFYLGGPVVLEYVTAPQAPQPVPLPNTSGVTQYDYVRRSFT